MDAAVLRKEFCTLSEKGTSKLIVQCFCGTYHKLIYHILKQRGFYTSVTLLSLRSADAECEELPLYLRTLGEMTDYLIEHVLFESFSKQLLTNDSR